MAGFCREYIPNYARIAAPLENLLKGKGKNSLKQISWTQREEDAFKGLKRNIGNKTSRFLPDNNKTFLLITDASSIAIGAILAQKDEEGRMRMISAYSKRLDTAQQNYTITERELLAIVKACEHFKHYLWGKEFELHTDHKALTYLQTCKDPTLRLLRWALSLQQFDIKIVYIKGGDNIADCLSRINQAKVTNENKRNKMVEGLTKDDIQTILKQYHIKSGHGSVKTMKFLIDQKFKWDRRNQDIEEYVQSCKTCQEAGPQRQNSKNRIIRTSKPNELWECDLLGRILTKEKRVYLDW